MTDDQSQYGNPRGDEGFETMKEMNEEHVPQITWGIEHLPEIRPVNILDVGCGGGIFTRMMLERYPGSRGCGIDISESAIEYADEFDSEFVDIGRLQLTIGDVQDMPYSNGTFDVVVSNASHFFWKDLKAGFREINRVMVPDGILCLTAGMHFSDSISEDHKFKDVGIINLLTDDEIIDVLKECGFSGEYYVAPNDEFCTYIARKL